MFSPANNCSSTVFKMLLACSLNTFSFLSQHSVCLVGLGARYLQRGQTAVSYHYSIRLPFLQSVHVLEVFESPNQRTEIAFRTGSFCKRIFWRPRFVSAPVLSVSQLPCILTRFPNQPCSPRSFAFSLPVLSFPLVFSFSN